MCHDHGATPGSPQGGHSGVGHSHSQGRPAGASPRACSQAGALLQVCPLPAWPLMTWMILLNLWNQYNQACCWRCSGLWKQSYHWISRLDCARSCVQHDGNHALKKQMHMADWSLFANFAYSELASIHRFTLLPQSVCSCTVGAGRQ